MKNIQLRLEKRLIMQDKPMLMGIINASPDSFYSGSVRQDGDSALELANKMLKQGADIIDVGAHSTKPGASIISEREEWSRLFPILEALRNQHPDIFISVDTFRSEIARKVVDNYQVQIINDISGGDLDCNMGDFIAETNLGYIIMHMRGTPANMQNLTDYTDVVGEVIQNLANKVTSLREKGVANIIVDPGFGFAKTLEQNYQILNRLKEFEILNAPILTGLSRKSMIWKTLKTKPENCLNGTTVLNTIALMNGANILRVHDIPEALETIKLFEKTNSFDNNN